MKQKRTWFPLSGTKKSLMKSSTGMSYIFYRIQFGIKNWDGIGSHILYP